MELQGNSFRTLIQQRLAQIDTIDSGVPIPDGMVEVGKTYFGYEIQEIYRGSDYDKNYETEISVTGRLVRRVVQGEQTLSILDDAMVQIKQALKDLNFKYSWNDISMDNNIRKIFVSANTRFSELNNELVL